VALEIETDELWTAATGVDNPAADNSRQVPLVT